MAYRFGIGDTVTWTDSEGVKREGVIKRAGYVRSEGNEPGRYIQDEYGRPGVLIECPGDSKWSWRFALGSEITVVGGERRYPEDERPALKVPAPCPGYGNKHESGHWDCFGCYPD